MIQEKSPPSFKKISEIASEEYWDSGFTYDFPYSFDWSYRHNDNYITDRDEQHSNNCWSYSTVAAVESHMLLTGRGEYDFSELGLMWECQERVDCYLINYMGCNGGSARHAIGILGTIAYEESSNCYPNSDLENPGYPHNSCSCPNCVDQTDDNSSNDPYSCSAYNLGIGSGMKQNIIITQEMVKYHLLSRGPLTASFAPGPYGGIHNMLIYGYSGNNWIVKDSAYNNYQDRPMSDTLYNIAWPESGYSEFCQNDDGDAFCWWGISSMVEYHDPFEIFGLPSSCDGKGCSRNEPDFNDYVACEIDSSENSNGGCAPEFACGDGVCQGWESCRTGPPNGGCFNDCYIPGYGGRSDACCGNGIFEEVEDCSNCPQDVPGGCPECSDRIDNDGDGFVDYQGYVFSESDQDCENFEDDSESTEECICGDNNLCGDEICELTQESNVICYDALAQDKKCYGPFSSSDDSYWDKGAWMDNKCYPLVGTTTRDCENCENWIPNWDDCKTCPAVDGINPEDYLERVYVTETECRQKRYSDNQWVNIPFETYPRQFPKTKDIHFEEQSPGESLKSSIWNKLKCALLTCSEDS